MNTYRFAKFSLVLLAAMVAASLPAMGQAVVSCNSNDMHRHYCDIGPNDGVRVASQHSHAACIEGRTFGVHENQMWVDGGCRADFAIVPDRRRGGYDRDHDRDRHDNHGMPYRDSEHDRWDRGPVASSTVYCASDNMRRNFCSIGPSRNIRLIRKRSDAPCDFNRTYGFDRGGIWVDRGCRADFEVVK
jgi:Protein of unknown function (DUF3011)